MTLLERKHHADPYWRYAHLTAVRRRLWKKYRAQGLHLPDLREEGHPAVVEIDARIEQQRSLMRMFSTFVNRLQPVTGGEKAGSSL